MAPSLKIGHLLWPLGFLIALPATARQALARRVAVWNRDTRQTSSLWISTIHRSPEQTETICWRTLFSRFRAPRCEMWWSVETRLFQMEDMRIRTRLFSGSVRCRRDFGTENEPQKGTETQSRKKAVSRLSLVGSFCHLVSDLCCALCLCASVAI